jgi:chromate transporter
MPDRSGVAGRPVKLRDLLSIFFRIGLTSFGGGLSAWMHRELVERRGWVAEQTFLTGLTLAQVLPGATAVNLSLYLGLYLRGGLGAAVAGLGMLLPPLLVVLALGALYSQFETLRATHFVLGGVAAAGVGMMLSLGIKAGRRLGGALVPGMVAVVTFVCIGVLHWPMVPVVACLGPVSVALAYRQRRRARHG